MYKKLKTKIAFNSNVFAQMSYKWTVLLCWWERVHLRDIGLDVRKILKWSYGKKRWAEKHYIYRIRFREKRWAFVKAVMGNWV
jgi:hypothetical protein